MEAKKNNAYRKGRDYLRSVRVIDLQIMRLNSKKNALEQSLLPGAIRYDLDKVQTSKEEKHSKIVTEIVYLERQINELIDIRFDRIQKISRDIDKLSDEDEKTVLTYYFVEHQKIEVISDKLGYSDQGIYGIMRRGCINISKVIGEK